MSALIVRQSSKTQILCRALPRIRETVVPAREHFQDNVSHFCNTMLGMHSESLGAVEDLFIDQARMTLGEFMSELLGY
jgi:hypothetical protein